MSVGVQEGSAEPTAAWRRLVQSGQQRAIRVQFTAPAVPPPQHARFVCMSDTHSLTAQLRHAVPAGDVFVHAGDFTRCGQPDEVREFNRWLGKLPHKHKIVIAGNHELSFDPSFTHPLQAERALAELPLLGESREAVREALSAPDARQLLTDCTYLQDSSTVVCGIKVYGTPWQPEFCKWAFNLARGAPCLERWMAIPLDTDVLVTHTPPLGHGDLCCSNMRAGCLELLAVLQQRLRVKYHVFGHIHEGYGISSDGKIIFINASTCNINYLPDNPPIVFDIKMPPGAVKD